MYPVELEHTNPRFVLILLLLRKWTDSTQTWQKFCFLLQQVICMAFFRKNVLTSAGTFQLSLVCLESCDDLRRSVYLTGFLGSSPVFTNFSWSGQLLISHQAFWIGGVRQWSLNSINVPDPLLWRNNFT